MNSAHLLEAGMLICFGFSWPINVVKAFKAGTAKSTSLAFICLIITGYIMGIGAKLINHQINYVLAVYLLNLVIVFSNVLVYFRNKALDKKRELSQGESLKMKKQPAVVYAHEEQIITSNSQKETTSDYSITLLGGTYAKDIPVNKLKQEFNFDFELTNKSTFALSLVNAKEYYEKYVAESNPDGIIIQLGKEDVNLFKTNPTMFDTIYLELIARIKSQNKNCSLALVSIGNPAEDTAFINMNNHISAIAQSEQAAFVNLENAKLWNPVAVQSSLDFAYGMGLKIKKPVYDVATILYSYASQHLPEEKTLLNIAV